MRAKDYLNRARRIDRRIGETRERLKRMREQLEGIARSPGGKPWTDYVDSMIDLERRMNRQVGELCGVKMEVMDAIETVEDGVLREVLELYYLDGLSWAEVAGRMHYSIRNVQILHSKALGRVRVPGA